MLTSDGIPELRDGKMTLLKDSGTLEYRSGFTIGGNKGLFGSLIKSRKLNDLEYGGKVNWQGIALLQLSSAIPTQP